MADQRQRVEQALRGLAEAGVPETMDLWPAIVERVAWRRTSQAQTSEEPAGDVTRRRTWTPRLVPGSLLGWVLAAFSVLILGAGVYAASGLVGEIFRQGLPGTVEPGSETEAPWNLDMRPDAALSALRTEVDRTLTADGARLTLDWAYADERYVAVGLHTQRFEDPRDAQHTDNVLFQPSLWDDTVGKEAELPPHTKITDASGQDFDTVGGGTLLGPNRTGADATFDAPEGIEPGRDHRFRLVVPLVEEPVVEKDKAGMPGEEPDSAGPFVFDFKVPVRPAPTIEVGQEVEKEGITLTLERVVDSPVVPQAVVCFEPPDDEHSWTPWLKDDGVYEKVGSAPQKLGGSPAAPTLRRGCWSLGTGEAMEGRSSVTVTNLEGFPRGPMLTDKTDAGTINPKTIRGPWTFEFEVPGS